MPFPLAHPVAVLPLRRWCPRHLSLIGLVIGSLTPDTGYAVREWDLNKFTHSFAGSFAWCLPVGLLGVLLVFALRRPLAATLPAPHRLALEPLCTRPLPAWWRIALSVLIGAWTHIVFDAVTHESAWQAYQAEPLRDITSGLRRKEIYQVLWIGVSLLSMGIMARIYCGFLQRTTGSRRLLDCSDRRPLLLWAAVIVGPYLAVALVCFRVFSDGPVVDKRTVYRTFQPYLLLLSATIIVLGLIQHRRRRGRLAAGSPEPPGSPDATAVGTPPRPPSPPGPGSGPVVDNK